MKQIQIDGSILEKYPQTKIGYAVFDKLSTLSGIQLPDKVDSLRRVANKFYNLNSKNILENSTISRWRTIYEDCGVRTKKHKSSIEALSRRFVKSDYRPIHNVVDIYNHVSYGNMVPMGGYSLNEISEKMILRFSHPEDRYSPLNGNLEGVPEGIVVYADNDPDDNVICWMWNHKDSKRTMLHPKTDLGLFIIDTTLQEEHERIDDAVEDLREILEPLGATQLDAGTIDQESPTKTLNI